MICFQHRIISVTLGTHFATATGKHNVTAIACIYLNRLAKAGYIFWLIHVCIMFKVIWALDIISLEDHDLDTSSTSTTNLEEDIMRMVDDTHTGIGMQSS